MRALLLMLCFGIAVPSFSEEALSAKKTLEAIEEKIQIHLREAIESSELHNVQGLVPGVPAVAKLAGVKVEMSQGLQKAMQELEDKLEIVSDKSEGLIPRFKRVRETVLREATTVRFRNEYGEPSKMSEDERLRSAERFVDTAARRERDSRRLKASDEERLRLLKKLFPNVAEESSSLNQGLESFEKVFRPNYGSKAPSVKERLAALEKIGETLIPLREQGRREKMTFLERATEALKKL